MHRRDVPESRELVIGERGICDLAAVELDVLEQRAAERHNGRAGDLRRRDRGVDRRPAVDDVHEL